MSDDWTIWPAPAKLNLFLHIVGRRDDGYHLLQTLFQLLDWGDSVQLRVRADGAIVRHAEVPGVALESDLCLRAAQALKQRTGCRLGAEVALDKRLPIGGGLGGGSSDAATVLVALNELWATGLDVDELARIGVGLGADVPLFVRGRTAWAEGVGELLTPVALPMRDFVIVDPRAAVPTASLFQAPELTRNSAPMTISGYLAASGAGADNAFEPVARARYPQVAAALDWLGQFAAARLTGSGGCVFAAVESVERARELVRSCPPAFVAHYARGVARSPLLDAVERYRNPACAGA
jgi:4-diphosphocytidyl-2-C-methyl-D-erythritol kinase